MPDPDQDRAALRTLLDEWATPPPDMIDILPKGGMSLRYLDHAHVTRALIECDPAWSWEPTGTDDQGQPVMTRDDHGRPVGMWIYLTVCGVRRPGYGSIEYRDIRGEQSPAADNAIKMIISDSLKVAAMRFGVALDLWGKDRAAAPAASPAMGKHSVPAAPAAAAKGWSERRCRAEHDALVVEFGVASVALSFAHFDIIRLGMLDDKMLSDIREHLLANRPPEDSTPF